MFNNIKMKATLIILFTFLVGMLAGALINRAIMQHEVKKFLRVPPPQIFVSHLERLIEPTPEQREAVTKVLEKYAKKFMEMHSKIQKTISPIQEELKKELYPLLTKQQKDRLEHRFSEMERFDKRRRFKGGPPPPPWDDHKDGEKPPFHEKRMDAEAI